MTQNLTEDSTDAAASERAKPRTVWIWASFGFCCYEALNIALQIVLQYFIPPTSSSDSEPLASLLLVRVDTWQLALETVAIAVLFAAGLALLNLRASAVKLFLIGLSLSFVADVIYPLVLFARGTQTPGLLLNFASSVLTQLPIIVIISVYAIRLKRREMLS